MKEEKGEQERFSIRVPDVLKGTIAHLLEGFTGLASSKRENLVRSIGYVLQGLTAGRFLETFAAEWRSYVDEGRIKPDYDSTEQCRCCLQELLDFLDKDLPDDKRFSILKQIFLVAATEEVSDRNSHLPLQYMQIARRLTAGEVVVLNTTYRLAKKGHSFAGPGGIIHADKWLTAIAEESGLTHNELVEMHEAKLVEKHLLTNRKGTDRSGAYLGETISRLTMLGYAICEYINHYEDTATVDNKSS